MQLAGDSQASKRRRLDDRKERRTIAADPNTSWIQAGDGAYDCTVTPTIDPCENVIGYNLLPLPPNCRQYMFCDNHKLSSMFSCAEGKLFDHLVKRCVSEDLADCPCRVSASDIAVTTQARPYGIRNGNTSGSTVDGTEFTYVSSREFNGIKDSKTAKVYTSKSAKLAGNESSSKSAKLFKGQSKSGKLAKEESSGSSVQPPGNSTSSSTSVSPLTPSADLERCPQTHDSAVEYKENDTVSMANPNSEVTNIYQCEPTSPETTCGDIWLDGWILTGVCDDSKTTDSATSVTNSPDNSSADLTQNTDAIFPTEPPIPTTASPSNKSTSLPVKSTVQNTANPTTVTHTESRPITPNPTPFAITTQPVGAVPDGCPPAYDNSDEYSNGDLVSTQNPSDPDVYTAYKCEHSTELPMCNNNEPNILNPDWTFIGICHGELQSPAAAPDGCPPAYDISSEYTPGDLVSAPDPENDELYIAYGCQPTDEFPSCNNNEPNALYQGWLFLAICHDRSPSVVTNSPIEEMLATKSSGPIFAPATPFPTLPLPSEARSFSCMSAGGYENFESGSFPISPWTTSGDGSWTIDKGNTYEGMYSIKSPDLSGTASFPAVSNATISTCETFAGGTMTLGVKASVLPPSDMFGIFIDGINDIQLVDVNEWREVIVDLPPGRHVIDFSYQYNVFNLDPLLPSPPTIEGAVYIDDIVLAEMVSRSSNFIIDIENILQGHEKRQSETSGGTASSKLLFGWFHIGLGCIPGFLLAVL
ncbi:hypothetical protein ACHAXR_012900 [Thalassiosira sp. AJA248-18]